MGSFEQVSLTRLVEAGESFEIIEIVDIVEILEFLVLGQLLAIYMTIRHHSRKILSSF